MKMSLITRSFMCTGGLGQAILVCMKVLSEREHVKYIVGTECLGWKDPSCGLRSSPCLCLQHLALPVKLKSDHTLSFVYILVCMHLAVCVIIHCTAAMFHHTAFTHTHTHTPAHSCSAIYIP
jgi:hypothetical protein